MPPERSNLRRFLAYAWPYRYRLALSTFIGVLKYNLPVAFPWLLKDAIDNILSGKPSRLGLSLDGLMAAAVVVFVAYAGITYLRTHIADRLAHLMILDVRRDLFRHLQRLPLRFFHDRTTGALSSRLITDVSLAQSFVGLAGTNVFMDLTSLLSITVVVFVLNWKLALVALATLPLFFILQKRLGARMRRNAREARRRMELLEGGLHETIAGISEVKSFTQEGEEERRFVARCRHFLEAAFENIRTHTASLGTTALLTRVPPVIVVWVGGHLVLGGELTVGALLALYAYLEMVFQPLNRLSELNLQLANSRAAIDRLFELLDEEPEPADEGAPALQVQGGAIELEDVTFGYRPGRPVLGGVRLRVEAGERVALVGPSGAGKSTLAKLLVRFHDPWEGRILVDGQDIREVSLGSLRSSVGLVQQDPVLFSGTIADNIRIGRAEATEAEIRDAAHRANASRFIDELPGGFETEIGERGVKLSGGQQQRIAIARAFLKGAPILLLDESTSNLDATSEGLVYEALERLMEERTTIIIAHRLSTVVHASRIVVLDRGRIVQEGLHADLLLETDGLYHRLYHGALLDAPSAAEGPSAR